MKKSMYFVTLYVEATEEDAASLRNYLAQSIADEFNLERVEGVTVTLDPDNGCLDDAPDSAEPFWKPFPTPGRCPNPHTCPLPAESSLFPEGVV